MIGDTHTALASTSAADVNAEMQRFVQQLAADVSGPPLQLPSYPVTVLQAQRILVDPNASMDQLIRIVGSEPVLAAKIVMLANSAALKRSGKRITDLRSAVSRLGFDVLRTAAISFAVSQLRNAAAYRSIAEPMRQLCETSADVAATSYVLARQFERASPDSALLAGLVSGMGKLYILTRASQYPALFADAWTREEMLHSWHAQVAQRILENWQLAPEVVEAVADMERATQDSRTRPNLADVLACAQTISQLKEFPDQLAIALTRSRAAQRLGLTSEICAMVLAQSAAELAQLRRALHG